MSAVACWGRQPWVLHHWAHWWLVGLLAGVLILSGCGLGSQENPDNTSNVLNGIVALSASDAWAVGWASGQGSSPLIEHWDGRGWSLVPTPGKGDRSLLTSVAASSAQDVWAVGDFFQGSTYETLIEHWNGASWSVVPGPNGPGSNALRSVAVVSATDVWAVGDADPCPEGHACASLSHPLIEHWDGHTWSLVKSPLPDPHALQAYLDTVVAVNAQSVWASGTSIDPGHTPADGAALVEQWDGTAWRIRTDFDTALVGRMSATAFFSNRDIWGAEYTTGVSHNVPTIQHWNGSAWSVVAGPRFGAGGYFVGAMAASAPDDLWAVGDHEPAQPSGGRGQVFSMHWNGSVWSLVPSPTPTGGDISLEASASLSPNDAWMVGQDSPSATIQLTFIEHWDGHAWSLVPNPNSAQPAPVGQ